MDMIDNNSQSTRPSAQRYSASYVAVGIPYFIGEIAE